jgi:small-conductance mechanosensitive channel
MIGSGHFMDIGRSFREATDTFFAYLPNILGFLVILLVGFIVAKVVAKVVGKILDKLGMDRRLKESQANSYVEKVMPGASPSRGIARVVFWLVFVFFLFSAIGALRIPALTTFMNQVLAYLPNVIVAIVIFVLASLIAGAVAGGVAKVMGDTPTGKIVATIVPAIVMVIAMFMILEQLQIAPEIVRIAFAATMGALALGLALAFGLGGRGVAQQMLEDAYRKGREQRDQVRRDVEQGRARTEEHASAAQDRMSEGNGRTGESVYAPQATQQMGTPRY